jgi:hypothetical protein
MSPQETVSGDSAAMKEAYARAFSTHPGCEITESRIQQCENIVQNAPCCSSLPFQQNIYPPPFFFINLMLAITSTHCNCYISSRKINHCGALLNTLILCPHVQDTLFVATFNTYIFMFVLLCKKYLQSHRYTFS